jgi:hypothetical protein
MKAIRTKLRKKKPKKEGIEERNREKRMTQKCRMQVQACGR